MLVNAIITHLKSVTFLPNDILYNSGDISSEIFFIKSGKVKVIKNDQKTISAILKDSDVFGADEIFSGKRREFTIQVYEIFVN